MKRTTSWNDEYECWSSHKPSADVAAMLAAYENSLTTTGDDVMTPCEVITMRNELERYKKLEAEGYIPPCKAGDTVFVDTNSLSQKHWHYRITHHFMKAEVVAIRKTKKQTLIKIKPFNPDREWARDYTTFPISAFGKTLFHTLEDGETARKQKEDRGIYERL